MPPSSEDIRTFGPPLRPVLTQPGTQCAWICNADGEILDRQSLPAFPENRAFPEGLWDQIRQSGLLSAPDSAPRQIVLATNLEPGRSPLFSCRQIPFAPQPVVLIEEVKPGSHLSDEKEQLIAEAFGLYAWHFHLGTGRFEFSPKGKALFFPQIPGEITYEDFYTNLAPESLERFARVMEKAINTGAEFREDLMLESPGRLFWIRMEGRALLRNEPDAWIFGFVQDLSEEKKREEEKNKLDLWLNAGMMEFTIQDQKGTTLAHWGEDRQGPAIQIEKGGRFSTLFDFRNQVKYKITARTGWNPEWESISPFPVSKPAPLLEREKMETTSTLPSPLPIDKLPLPEKCVALTQWLGQSLDCQIASIGFFDGSRFEWKAWWKSPNRFAFPVRKYDGEWLPELEWLVEMEHDLAAGQNPVWWPQDMLPFSIPDDFGKGWMILAEMLDDKHVVLFALKTLDPEGVREKTQHVRKTLDLLKNPAKKTGGEPGPMEILRKELALKDLLIREMNHRAKNNLALAASLVKMEGSHTEDQQTRQILKDTRQRLETLASLHEMMYRQPDQTGTVSVSEFLGSLIQGLVRSFGSPNLKTEINLEDCQLPVKMANTLGLLVNELLANAFKYALNQTPNPVLRVDFHDRGEYYKLRIGDNGPGKASGSLATESLGTFLIEEFVKQLDASMEIDTSLGTTYLISIKKNTFELR